MDPSCGAYDPYYDDPAYYDDPYYYADASDPYGVYCVNPDCS
jgi:hypothetical protein